MRRTRVTAAALLIAILLNGCRSDNDPVGPTTGQAVISTRAIAADERVSVDTLNRTTLLSVGRGVSNAGGIPVLALNPATGTPGGGVWTADGITFLPEGGAAAITASGEVLGSSAGGITIWGAAGARVVGQGDAYALNDRATVLIGFTSGPLRWDGGVLSMLQQPGEGVQSAFPLAVNNAGTVVGAGSINGMESRAIRWDGTVPSFLPDLAPGGAHGALAIDNAGRIVGYSTGTVDGLTGRFPVIWVDGVPRPLPKFGAETVFGNAQDIDDAGNIVGWMRIESGEDHAALWTAGGELIDLGASLPGLNTYARGVNGGVVSGIAFYSGENPDVDQGTVVRWTMRPSTPPPPPTRYTFDGFFAPLANPPAVNQVKAGKGVAVRFSLGKDFGLSVFETGYPQARTVECEPTAPVHAVNEAVNAKNSGLTFDPVSQRYTYLWKTERSSVGACAELVFRFDDGQERVALFSLSR
jgi:probable HAF family extracellular repeat protein